MNELETRCLDSFPEWLRTLAADAGDLADLLREGMIPVDAKQLITGGLNYLFKSLDLIPDGIEDLGYLDDAFVIRVAAELALTKSPTLRESAPALTRLAGDAPLIAELLGKDYARLEMYVRTLTKGAARGRTVDEILGGKPVLDTFLGDVRAWSQSYDAPTFARDEKNLVKLQSFLSAKLPPA